MKGFQFISVSCCPEIESAHLVHFQPCRRDGPGPGFRPRWNCQSLHCNDRICRPWAAARFASCSREANRPASGYQTRWRTTFGSSIYMQQVHERQRGGMGSNS